MEIKRFIKEYANYQMNDIESNDLMQKPIKDKALNTIKKALNLHEKGFITVSETIMMICKPFSF